MTTAGGAPDAAAPPEPDPAWRVPLPGGGPSSGAWSDVRMLGGLPMLLADPDAFIASWDPSDGATDLLDLGFEALAYLARYMPALRPEVPRPLHEAVHAALAAHAPAGAELAIEAGCGVGAELRLLRQFARRVIGFDLSVPALGVARRQLAGERLDLLARVEGRRFDRAGEVTWPPIDGVSLAIGNVLDPPLRAGVADIALALNVLDNVAQPLLCLGQLDAVLAPGGLLIVGSPFAWQEAITPAAEQLGGSVGSAFPGLAHRDSGDIVCDVLAGACPALGHLAYDILARSDVPWEIRDHARCVVRYDVHLIVARKR